MNVVIIWVLFLLVWVFISGLSVQKRRERIEMMKRRMAQQDPFTKEDDVEVKEHVSSSEVKTIDEARTVEKKDNKKLRESMKDSGLVSDDEYDLTDL